MNSAAKKILFIVFQSNNRSNGGVESISQIICHLRAWKCFLLTNRETHRNQVWEKANVHLQIGCADISGSLLGKLQSVVKQNIRTYKFIRQHKINLVHSNDIRSMITSAVGVKLANAKLVFNIRDIKSPRNSYGFTWYVAKYLADYILMLSSEMQEQIIRRLRANKKKVGYQYSVVDFNRLFPYELERKQNVRKNLSIPIDTFSVGMVAAFMPKKQQLEFIQQAVPLLIKAIPNVLVYFIGDFDTTNDPYSQECLQAAQENGSISRLKFAGYQPNISDWYNLLDVTLVASEREGLARCMIESIACGTPVISFDVCSAKEILEINHCGIVVKWGDYKSLVEAIGELYQNQATYRKLSKNGYEISRSLFDRDKIVDHYEQLYNSLLS